VTTVFRQSYIKKLYMQNLGRSLQLCSHIYIEQVSFRTRIAYIQLFNIELSESLGCDTVVMLFLYTSNL